MAKPTVATFLFQNMNQDHLVDNTYDYSKAALRAVKVFMISYAGIDSIYPQLYQQKLEEYVTAIEELYDCDLKPDYIQTLETVLTKEKITLKVGVIGFRGRELIVNPVISSDYLFKQIMVSELDTNSEEQKNIFGEITMSFNEWKDFRINDSFLYLRLTADKWTQREQPLNFFSIKSGDISPQGFEEWVDFGRGVQLLIKIRFNATNDNMNANEAKDFHFYTILAMIEKRVDAFNNSNMNATGHMSVPIKLKVSYINGRVDYNSEECFWWTSGLSNDLQTVKTGISDKTLRNKPIIKYNDLQIGPKFDEQLKDNVCLCSEWCNLNAFFHHNPIYRFLTVQHNQLYLTDRSNIPDIYLFATVRELAKATVDDGSPLLLLMSSANDYRNLYYNRFFLTDPNYQLIYGHSHPLIVQLIGVSYNMIRKDIKISSFALDLSHNPFEDICLQNIINYYKVFSDLHTFCSLIPDLVALADRTSWFKEFDGLSRKHYKTYLGLAYDTCISEQCTGYDDLFTADYEYCNVLSQNEMEREVQSIRAKVTDPFNPMKCRVFVNETLYSFISVYKFIQLVEPRLPSYKSRDARKDVFQCCKDFDNFYDKKVSKKGFQWSYLDLTEKGLAAFETHFIVFYTLRLYSIGFAIQTYCIDSLHKHNKGLRKKTNLRKVSTHYVFIFTNDLFDQTFNDIKHRNLFQINDQIETQLYQFYDVFWQRANHEINKLPDLKDNIDSAFVEYQRLYFWWRNGGNDKRNFIKTMNTLTDGFIDIINRSEKIFNEYILESMKTMVDRYEYTLEAMDVLVCYLIKANAFMFLSTTTEFLKQTKILQSNDLVKDCKQYAMCKPGWVPLFRSMGRAFEYCNRLKSLYIVFDDHWNRIANTVTQTRRLIKDIFRDLYKELCVQWVSELHIISRRNILNPNLSPFILLHIASGLSFLAAFNNDFRQTCRYYRKWFNLIQNYNSNLPQEKVFNDSVIPVQSYLSDPIAIENATPFLETHWRQELVQTLAIFGALTADDLDINLIEANH